MIHREAQKLLNEFSQDNVKHMHEYDSTVLGRLNSRIHEVPRWEPYLEDGDLPYVHFVIYNDKTNVEKGDTDTTNFVLTNPWVVGRTLTGVAYLKDTPVATFFFDKDGKLESKALPKHHVIPRSGTLNHFTGEIDMWWAAKPGPCHLVVDYNFIIPSNDVDILGDKVAYNMWIDS